MRMLSCRQHPKGSRPTGGKITVLDGHVFENVYVVAGFRIPWRQTSGHVFEGISRLGYLIWEALFLSVGRTTPCAGVLEKLSLAFSFIFLLVPDCRCDQLPHAL